MNEPTFMIGEREAIENAIHLLLKNGLQEAENSQCFWHDVIIANDCQEVSDVMGCCTVGATKTVFFLDDCDHWVIKIGRTKEEDHWCAKEVEIYQKACASNLQEYFAATYLLGEFGGWNFYIQERAYCDDNYVSDYFYSAASANYDKDDFEDEEDYYEAVSDAADNMSDEETIMAVFCSPKLLEFLQEEELNDFHAGNFGEIGDYMVLVDYSGYRKV
jgi:hypothetical protein